MGLLNSILTTNTLALHYCVLAIHAEIDGSWSYETVKRLRAITVDENIDEKINPVDFLKRAKSTFKPEMKSILYSAEIRKLVSDTMNSKVIWVPQQVFKTSMPR